MYSVHGLFIFCTCALIGIHSQVQLYEGTQLSVLTGRNEKEFTQDLFEKKKTN